MRALLKATGVGSKALSYVLGTTAIGLAITVMSTSMDVAGVIDWTTRIFGSLFLVMLVGLVYVAALSWVKISTSRASDPGVKTWFEAGIQAANGVATVALTYTLLGISLGIGGLADQTLSPATIQEVIRGLTEHFSMAFMTTVVGLPISALLRAGLLVSYSRAQERETASFQMIEGETS
jgi:hypothetical protein